MQNPLWKNQTREMMMSNRLCLAPKHHVKSFNGRLRPQVIHLQPCSVRFHGDHVSDPDPRDKQVAPRNRSDWEMMKVLTQYIWPKGDINSKVRVISALGLLVGGKVRVLIDYTS
jgi:hypothetical protein